MEKYKLLCFILLIIIIFLIGGIIGINYGMMSLVDYTFQKSVYFMKVNNCSVTIDTNFLIYGINQYKQKINRCYPNNFSLNTSKWAGGVIQ